MPEEFKEGVLLGIFLPRQELLMLIPSDAATRLEIKPCRRSS